MVDETKITAIPVVTCMTPVVVHESGSGRERLVVTDLTLQRDVLILTPTL